MVDFFKDSSWQVTGILLGVLSIIISILQLWFQRNRKMVSYQIVTQVPIIKTSDTLDEKLQMKYKGQEIRDISLVVIKIINSGKVPILSSDFINPIVIEVDPISKVLSADVSEINIEGLNAQITATETSVTLSPTLLNPNDSLSIKMIINQYTGNIRVKGQILGVQSIDYIHVAS